MGTAQNLDSAKGDADMINAANNSVMNWWWRDAIFVGRR